MRIYVSSVCVNVLLILGISSFSASVELPEDWKQYIKNIATKFEEGKLEKDFQLVIPPRCKTTEKPNASLYTLPNVYLCDPLSQYADIYTRFPFTCPRHEDTLLTPKQWTDGSTNALNPRVILDTNGPGLLIARNYYCNSGETRHYVRATDGDLMNRIAKRLHRPFKMTHKYTFTNSYAQRLRDSVSNGISFNHLQSNYIEWQLQDCAERKQRFDWHKTLWDNDNTDITEQDGTLSNEYEDIFNMHRQRMIELCPSDDLLCDIFLKDFESRKSLYEEAMRLTQTTNALMADHTFKVCKMFISS